MSLVSSFEEESAAEAPPLLKVAADLGRFNVPGILLPEPTASADISHFFEMCCACFGHDSLPERPRETFLSTRRPSQLSLHRPMHMVAHDMRGDTLLLLVLVASTLAYFSKFDFDLKRSAFDDA